MKKIGSILLILVLSFILFPILVNATSKETDYISIYDSVDISLDSITFKDAHYDNPRDLKNLIVDIYNKENDSSTYELVISYYDEAFNLLGDSGKYNISTKGKASFSQHFYRIDKDKIKYFKLSVNRKINSTSTTGNNDDQMNTSGDYYISDYDIKIIVNENNTFEITEKITANFNVAKHGIYRKIPKRNKITRLDGTTSNNRAKITDVVINDNYKSYSENGYKVFQIGNANKTITGSHVYNISYKYNIGKDPLKNNDELYFNLIGTEWDTHINKVTFSITMPKEFDKNKLGFSSGSIGTTDSVNVSYDTDGNLITGKMLKSLNAGEALTVRLTLPEGYFVGAGFAISFIDGIMFFLPFLFLGISIFLWYKFGRDD